MAAGTWRSGSLCTRCAARPPWPTANARSTTARPGLGGGRTAQQVTTAPTSLPPAAALPPRPVRAPRPPAPGGGSVPARRPRTVLRLPRACTLGGRPPLGEAPGPSVGAGRGHPQLRPSPGLPWPSTPSEVGAGVRLRRSHGSRAGGALIPQTLLLSEPRRGSGRDRERADTKHTPEWRSTACHRCTGFRFCAKPRCT